MTSYYAKTALQQKGEALLSFCSVTNQNLYPGLEDFLALKSTKQPQF